MSAGPIAKHCLIYVSVPHLGFGWVQGCLSILEQFSAAGLQPTLFLPKTFKSIPSTIDVTEALPRFLPYRYASRIALRLLNRQFRRALRMANPRDTIVYFWPSPTPQLISYATARGFLTVGEMINNCSGTTKVILDEAYNRLGLPNPEHRRITEQRIADQRRELALYDYIMSCNPRIERSLIENGIDPLKIVRSSFGWSPERLAQSTGEANRKRLRALFIGGDTVRKGVPQLLAAWKKSGVRGELLIVGTIDASLRSQLGPLLTGDDIRVLGFETDLGRLYKSADMFVFPSLEEGDPQVTYEAAGCGLPVIATSMGSAQVIKDGVNGLVVQPYDVDGLAHAISRLASCPQLRRRLGERAAEDAQRFTYQKVGAERASLLIHLCKTRDTSPGIPRSH